MQGIRFITIESAFTLASAKHGWMIETQRRRPEESS